MHSAAAALGLAALGAVLGVSASPVPADLIVPGPRHELLVREALDSFQDFHLEKRMSADFSLDHSWKNHVLFSGYVTYPGAARYLSRNGMLT